MKFQLDRRLVHSRVARRILTTFVLAVLLPLVIMAGGSLYQVSHELNSEGLRRVHQLAKSLGIGIFDRLQFVADELRILRTLPASVLERPRADLDATGDLWLRRRVEYMVKVSPDNTVFRLDGEGGLSPALRDAGRQVRGEMVGDKPVLMLLDDTIHIFERALDGDASGWLIGARLNMEQLWSSTGIADLAEDVCVLDEGLRPVYCNRDGLRHWLHNAAVYARSRGGPQLIGHDDGEPRLTAAWSLFLKPHYQVNGLTVLVGQRQSDALEPVRRYQQIFPLVVALVGIVAIWLSMRMIRSNLLPLEKIIAATRRLRRGDFDARLDLPAGDEFGEMGEAFNRMAGALGMQFRQIESLAALDRGLQQSRSVRSSLNLVASAVTGVRPDSPVAVVCHDRRRDGSRLWMVPFASVLPSEGLEVGAVHFDSALPATEWIGAVATFGAQWPFVAHLGDPGRPRVHVFPVSRDLQAVGLLLVGLAEGEELDDGQLRYLRQVADVLAIALHNQLLTKRLYYQANHDPLTGLPNRLRVRQLFRKRLEHAQETGSVLALMMIDVDRFKSINDTLGHAVGDILLGQFAQRLLECVREDDVVSRFSGDEFVLLVHCQDPSRAEGLVSELGERIDTALNEPFQLDSRSLQVSASKGAAVYPEGGETLEQLLQGADAAMYQVKSEGRGGLSFFSPSLRGQIEDRVDLEEALRRSLPGGEFELNYQPLVNVATGAVIGAEALCRWHRGGTGLIMPASFIQAAEEIGLIAEIGAWVLRRAALDMVGWQRSGAAIESVSVNVSTHQLLLPEFAEQVLGILAEVGLDPSLLVVEITETALIDKRDESIRHLSRLREAGVRVMVDDFGTGYASLGYLKSLPVDGIKIDRMFVDGLPGDARDRAIVRAVRSLGEELDLSLVAEGVETASQLDYLREAGIIVVQGFIFSPPLGRSAFQDRFLYDSRTLPEVASPPAQV